MSDPVQSYGKEWNSWHWSLQISRGGRRGKIGDILLFFSCYHFSILYFLKFCLGSRCYFKQLSSTSLQRLGSLIHSERIEAESAESSTKILEENGNIAELEENGNEVSDLEHNSMESEEVPLSEQKSLKVAIIGTPNSGKSTLINQLLGQKVSRYFVSGLSLSQRQLEVFIVLESI